MINDVKEKLKITSGIYKIDYKDKVYIGQSVNVRKRIDEHLRELKNNKHYNCHLQNAFNKYGEQYFKAEIIEYCDVNLLDDKEKYWIKFYDSYKNGYNQTSGGTGLGYNNKIYKYTYVKNKGKTKKEHKIINLSTKEYFDSVYDVKQKYNTLNNIYAIHKVCKGLQYTYKGYFFCYDYYDIDINEELRLAKNNYNNNLNSNLKRVKIINVITREIFNNINLASNKYNVSYQSILSCLSGKQKTTHGYIFMRYNDYLKNKDKDNNNIKKSKEIINVNTKKIYDNINQASKELNIPYSNILQCCNHYRNSVKGFQFEYYNENMNIDNIIIRKQKRNTKAKQIICNTTGMIYKSAYRASKELHLNPRCVLNVCNRKQKTTGGYVFSYYND